MQSAASIDDQVRECRAYAERMGWNVVEVYSDAALSGSSTQRPGYQRLCSDAERKRFDVVLTESMDRLSRSLADTASFNDLLTFYGVKIFTINMGEITPMHVMVTGFVGQQMLTELREKTKRGQRGRVAKGKSAGGLGYGYAVTDVGGRVVVPEQAEVILRIFREYAAGVSPREIARGLNRHHIPGPSGAVWKDTTIRGQRDRGTGILNNAAYVGKLIYGRTSYVKDPRTGKRVSRLQPEDQHLVTEVPELRIVPDDLWKAVKSRQEMVTLEMPKDGDGNALNRAHRKTHALSGLITCGLCGGPMAITGGGRYGCSRYRASRTCENSKTIPREEVEKRVFRGLKTRLFDIDIVGEFMAEFQREVARIRKERASRAVAQRKRFSEIDVQLERLVDALANGIDDPLIGSKIKSLRAERNDLLQAIGDSFDETVIPISNMEAIYRLQVAKLIDGLSDPMLRQDAISVIQSLVEKVIVTPTGEGFAVDIHGELGGILALVEGGTAKRPEQLASGRSLSVVAGVGFEPTTFRL
ncbi:recombinase family protein [Albimonas donghaensis]|uniref:recombinase family protein n=1 Tax=Albimonas donghaensis TaxID=356660 RepID=UPI003CCBEBB2